MEIKNKTKQNKNNKKKRNEERKKRVESKGPNLSQIWSDTVIESKKK